MSPRAAGTGGPRGPLAPSDFPISYTMVVLPNAQTAYGLLALPPPPQNFVPSVNPVNNVVEWVYDIVNSEKLKKLVKLDYLLNRSFGSCSKSPYLGDKTKRTLVNKCGQEKQKR